MSPDRLRIATRGSDLALWQARHVGERLRARNPGLEIELVVIKTTGDQILDIPLAQIGGKALFVKEVEQALLERRADLAVHSMKDVPAELAPGLHLAAISEREDPLDALCSRSGRELDALPRGARVGTSSQRRACLLRVHREDLQIAMLRGNVPTRLRKLDEGEFDAIVLAAAGLKRLGFAGRIHQVLPTTVSLPAVGQGALGVETRQDDEVVTRLVAEAVHHPMDARRVAAERAFLARLHGGCQTPLAAHAIYRAGELLLEGLVGKPDGSTVLRSRVHGHPDRAEELGAELAEELLSRGAGAILEACGGTPVS